MLRDKRLAIVYPSNLYRKLSNNGDKCLSNMTCAKQGDDLLVADMGLN